MTTKIKVRRVKLNIRQFHIARSLGVSCGKISQIESGRFTGTAILCERICELLNLDFEDYFVRSHGYRGDRGTAISYEWNG